MCELLGSTEALRAARPPPVCGDPAHPLPACGDPTCAPAFMWGPRLCPCLHVGTLPVPRLHVGMWLLERVTFPPGRPLGASPAEGTRCHGPFYPVSPLLLAGSQGGAKQASSGGTARPPSHPAGIQGLVGTGAQCCPIFWTPWTVATGSSDHGLLQASILGWAAVSCFRGPGCRAHGQELSERCEGSVGAAVTVSPHRRRPITGAAGYTWGGVTCPPARAALPGGAGGASVLGPGAPRVAPCLAPLCCTSTHITPELLGSRLWGASSQPSSGGWGAWPSSLESSCLLRAGHRAEDKRPSGQLQGQWAQQSPPDPQLGWQEGLHCWGRRASGKQMNLPCRSRWRLGRVLLQAGPTAPSRRRGACSPDPGKAGSSRGLLGPSRKEALPACVPAVGWGHLQPGRLVSRRCRLPQGVSPALRGALTDALQGAMVSTGCPFPRKTGGHTPALPA